MVLFVSQGAWLGIFPVALPLSSVCAKLYSHTLEFFPPPPTSPPPPPPPPPPPQIAGHALLKRYGKQFQKLLYVLCKDYMPK